MTATDVDVEVVDCGVAEAAYRIGARVAADRTCPEGAYDEYVETGGGGGGFRLCLALNAAEGDCFLERGSATSGTTSKVTCGPGATYKVERVYAAADEFVCESNENPVVYTVPPTTLCLVDP